MRRLLLTAVAGLALAVTAPALANNGGGSDGSTTFGGATVDKGVATLVSNTGNTATTDDFSGVTVPLPAGLTLAQITQLSAEYNVTDDDCAGGSPRFAINYGPNQNVFVYFGPSPQLHRLRPEHVVVDREPRRHGRLRPRRHVTASGRLGQLDLGPGGRPDRYPDDHVDQSRRRRQLEVHGQGADRARP